MAKSTSARRREQQRRAEVSLTRLTILDAVRVWVVPAIAAPAALVVYVLDNIEVIDTQPAVTAIGLLALVTVLWAGVRGFISEQTSGRLTGLLGLYAVLWLAATAIPFYTIVDSGPPLFSHQLHPQESTVLPVEGKPGRYRLVVEGAFNPSETHGDRTAHYRVALLNGETTEQVFEGDFTERYMRQRLGRRGSTTVRNVHTAVQHTLDDADGHAVGVSLTELAPAEFISAVTVKLYPETFPLVIFVAAGIALVIGSVVIDAWRPRNQSEGLMTTLTLSALLAIAALRAWGGPNPGFGQLAVQVLLGAVAGSVAAYVLARVARPLTRRLPAAP